MRTRIAGVCLLALMGSGCASIVNGTHGKVMIESEPSGAHFEVKNHTGKIVAEGSTPANVRLPRSGGYFRRGGYMVKFHQAGHDDVSVPIRQPMETGWYIAGNILFGWEIGWFIVDPLTGGMWGMEPSIHVSLPEQAKPENTATSEDNSEFRVKRDASGAILRDSQGNFIIEQVSRPDPGER